MNVLEPLFLLSFSQYYICCDKWQYYNQWVKTSLNSAMHGYCSDADFERVFGKRFQ